MPVRYRSFRNPDPPALVRIWNEACTGRGSAFLQGTTPLEHFVLAKRYFDPDGLIVAEVDDEVVGFAHAGFGPDASGQWIGPSDGVICALVVSPEHRRRGIGTGLLRQCESYLEKKGSQRIFFGSHRSRCPFYWGIYGGSEPPGILASDSDAEPFLTARGYRPWSRFVTLDCTIDMLPEVVDARFPQIRRTYEVRILPRPVSPSIYFEAVLDPLEALQFQLCERSSDQVVARILLWEMDLFGWRWHMPTLGLFDLHVDEGKRRQGFAKFLLWDILKYAQDQYFGLAEMQVAEDNEPMLQLARQLGFKPVDRGTVYEREPPK